MKTQTDSQPASQSHAHTPGALRLAQILIPEGIDTRGRASLLATSYGKKTREGLADLIDSETHAPELLAECETDLQWIENLLCDINAGRPLRAERIGEGLTARHQKLAAAIAKATT